MSMFLAVEAKLKAASDRAGNKKVLLDLRDVAAGDMQEADPTWQTSL